jgi:hypothetical protein
MSIFEEIITKYAQSLDPTQLQVGQEVYDQDGNPLVVIDNPADTTTKTLMPSNQQGAALPQGVQVVEDSELASQYTLQPGEAGEAVGPVTAQMDEEIAWNDITDVVNDLNSAVAQKDMKSLFVALEDLTTIAMMHVNLPSDVNIPSSFEKFNE